MVGILRNLSFFARITSEKLCVLKQENCQNVILLLKAKSQCKGPS